MKTNTQSKSFTFRKYILFLFLALPILFLILRLPPANLRWTAAPNRPPPLPNITSGIRIRPGYTSYQSYVERQVNKTLNPKLRKIWVTRDWDRKIQVFSRFFQHLKNRSLLANESKSLCIGARVGQEVEALRRVGVSDSVGIDLVPYPPLVIKGDFHNQPFGNETFDFEFSNVFDHALMPRKFVSEIERTLKAGGVCVLHVAVARRTDKYSANDLFSVKALVEMFKGCELVQVREVDGFGANTEVVFRKREMVPSVQILRS